MWLLLLACARPPACPPGLWADPARLDRLDALVPGGRPAAVCFGPGVEAAITASGQVRLDASWPDPALAARLAHLGRHRPIPPGPACLEAALRQEGEAWDAELRLRQALGAMDQPGSPPFAEAWTRGGPPAVEAWLRAHPDGAPGVPAALHQLSARCALP